jgi:ribosomal protein L37AE/L43A
MFTEKCPLCGTHGKIWNRKPEVWQCPNCASIFSRFGLVMESEREMEDFWS